MADIKQECNDLRAQVKPLVAACDGLKKHDFFESPPGEPKNYPDADRGEMQANIQLAKRHFEDARMRIGKVIQALEGGVSILDKS